MNDLIPDTSLNISAKYVKLRERLKGTVILRGEYLKESSLCVLYILIVFNKKLNFKIFSLLILLKYSFFYL